MSWVGAWLGGGGGVVGGGAPPVDLTPLDAGAAATIDSPSGDLALEWYNSTGDADLFIVPSDVDIDLANDQGLKTAVILSLFTDRRAEDDDVPPSGDPNDRRGWWADQFSEVEGDRIGSRLWLLDRGKLTNETRLRAEQYIREALAWMIEDKVASAIDVTVEIDKPHAALLFAVGIHRPGRDPTTFRFSHTWDYLQRSV